ncbi:MAG: hypothetical protein F6J92_03990 [Symploca sp. SIO1A3]|nr:hypothetical protein [Symploca sp. SIO1A3]
MEAEETEVYFDEQEIDLNQDFSIQEIVEDKHDELKTIIKSFHIDKEVWVIKTKEIFNDAQEFEG